MGAVGDDFYTAVLHSLGALVTPNTLQLCRQWQAYEGGSASWNPWNTTQWAPGSTVYNSAYVRNFPDEQTGVSATVSTLRNGYYPSVVAAFVADLPESEWGLNPAILNEINLWGTHGFAAYLQSIAQQHSGNGTSDVASFGQSLYLEAGMGLFSREGDNVVFAVFPSGLIVQVAGPDDLAALISAFKVEKVYPVSPEFIAFLQAAQRGA